MSAWNIYHKDGSKLTDVNGEQITVHGLEYSDSWMGECFLTINFKHEVPINFQIGDYIVYRGERFELNYEPGKDKQARPDTYGEGFVYDSVKFNALQDELARAEFLDVVLNDNELHYTSLPKFPFFVQTLDDLLDRIQANLDEQIGAGLWKIYSRNKDRSVQRGALESEWLSVYGEKTDDNVIESMSITVDSQTCWQALALVNEKWDINFIVRGRNIYVGTTGIQASHIFKYGLGNGLYEIVQNADSDQSVVTRLRAYGSEKNLPSHYYADLGVKYVANITKVVAATTHVELELDIDYIETYFKNQRKYIVSVESGEQSGGWVLKVTFDFKTEITGYVTQAYGSKKCRFYSELKGTQTDTGDEESKEKLDAFIAQVKAGNTKMYITSGLNKKAVPSSMKEYAKNLPNNMSINRLMLPGFPHVSLSDFYNTLTDEEKKYVNPTGRQHKFSTDPHRPYIDSINIEQIGLRSASQFFETDDKTNGVIEIYPTIEEMEIGGVRVDEIDEGVAPDDDGRFGDNETVKNVDIYLKKAIDFDINDLKDDDFSISMKDGMCGGRTFKVASSTKIDGRWRLTIERVKDDALELWFPYKDYPIKKGDHFVLTGITLPDSYVNAASLKLLKYAIAFIDKNDYTRYVYQPKVDEIFMARQHDLAEKDTTGVIKSLHDTLKAGDLMEFEDTDLRIGGVISIDQLTIKEEDGKIPTYDITLREDKEVGTIQKIQQQISSLQNGNGGTGAGLTTTQVKNQVATEGSKHFISKINDDIAKGTITWEKVQKFLQGLLVGGGSWTPDAEGRSHLITDYLEVRMKAIFEELVINKTSTIGGKEIISPAGGVVAHKVEEVTVTYNNVSQKAYRCYFLAEQEGDAVDNDFAVGDQVRSESFNVRKGTYHKAGNHFYWRFVIGRDEDPVELEGKKYHYIDLSDTDCATASDVPAKGDVLNQCGNRTDVERQNCLIFSAVDTYSPSISLYHGINSYSFANREYVEYGVNKQNNKAFFNVYGDMYVGDRPTKENGYEGSSYIRYDSSTKQLSVKGKISAKSTVDGKELSQYIKENTDDTVANAAKKAAEDAQKAAQTAQTDIKNLGKTVTDNKKEFDNYVTDGYLEPSEIAAMAQDSKRLEDDFAAAQKSYNEVKDAEVLKDTKELTDLNTAFATLTSAKTELIKFLSDISKRYNETDTDGKAAIVSAVGIKFTNFQSAYSEFYDKLGLANAYITRKIYGDLGVVIGDVSTYQYLKKVLADGVETEINGGLILTSLIALRDPETKRVESGINGVIDKTAKGNGIATWWGGYMNDGEVVGFDKKEDYSKQAATSLVRFDGSGYMANGAIWWGTDGKVHADPTSFIISEKNLGAYLIFFEPTWKEGSAGTSVADLVSLKPNAPFSKLGVSGDATFEGAISFHGIKLTYDSTNKAIKIDGNLYATGGITAYGAGASTTGGGGGLNGSVKSYADALKLTSESLSEIASAYSIKALDSRISSLEGGSATAISVSGSGNAVTSVTKNGTTISVVKGSTFLTSHQSLDGYVNAISVSGSGNAITSVSKSGKGITFTKGATFLTSHQSLANYYTKSSVDSLLSGKSATNHTHSVKINGVTKTIAATGGTAVDLGTYLTSHQSLADYAKKTEIPTKVSQLTNDNGYINSSGSCAYATSAGNADKVDGVHVTWAGELTSTSHLVAWESDGSALRDINPANVTVGNSDKLDGVHANGLLTALSNSDKGISITVGGTTKSVANISVNYASSAGNADTVDGVHVTWAGELTSTSHLVAWESDGSALRDINPANVTVGNSDKLDGVHANGLLTALSNSDKGISITVGGTTKSVANISVNYASSAGNADTVDGYHVNGSNVAPYGHIPSIENDGVMEVGKYIDFHNDNSGKHDFSTRLQTTGNYGNSVNLPSASGTLALTTDNVASAAKLQTPRTIWGQSFDGTGNVNGTIYINNSNSGNGAIRLNSDISSNARISAIDDQVIFNTGNAIRFGETAWDWNQWAGLKYTHSNKTIYLGIAEGSTFNAISAQSDGTLRLAGIKTITPDSGARIGNAGGDLFLGNSNNSAWVKVQDMCSQQNINNWRIYQAGGAVFDNLTINGGSSFYGSVKVNNMLTAKAIMFTTADSNAYGTDLQNWDGSIAANVTNMFNGISYVNTVIEYSTDGGSSWNRYTTDPKYRFNLVNDNVAAFNFYLGKNTSDTSSDANNLAQIKKNKLRVTVKVPDELYQELSWISVDVNNGVKIKCQVYFGNSSGVYTEYVSKVMTGWSHKCDICVGPLNVNVGNDTYRYVRLVFSHLDNHTDLRNGIISKIRALGLTKYSRNKDRYTLATTGHIYDYDQFMKVTFPAGITANGSILAKGGVTAYQSSDIRLKQDLRKLDYLGIIKAMGGTFGFAWKKDNTRSIGWIAQHVLCNPHLKDIVETDEKGYYKINYWSPKLIATAFGAIEQVGDEVSRLKARVVFLESEVQRLSGDKEDCNKKRLDNKNINSLN